MKLIEINSRRGIKKFLSFRSNLYKGDINYVCTEKFVLKMVLSGGTDFIKSCKKLPLQVVDNNKVLAQAILIHNVALPYIQVAFFDALPDCEAAVGMILSKADELKRKVNAKGIIVGLNAHISYGVGILTDGFNKKNSFDSQYNKSYYGAYFKGYPGDSLSTYKGGVESLRPNFPRLKTDRVKVRLCKLNKFREEMELLRSLCEKTIAKTHLYFPTQPLHFYQLIKTLKPFLRPENLLFAEDAEGNVTGFMFWYPDFNQVLKGGREYSLLSIGLSYLLKGKKIDTVKINALGSCSYAATFALIDTFRQFVENKYSFVETSFIWDNNIKSSLLMKKFFETYDRKYEVYYIR